MIEIRHHQSQEQLKRSYDELHKGVRLDHRWSYYLWLVELLRPQPGEKLIDISCGHGTLTAVAHQKGAVAFGLDFSLEAMLVCKKTEPAAQWMMGDGQLMPIETDSFDYVTNIGSLEHYQNPAAGMAEIGRILKPGGRACVLLPNTFGIWGNIKYVMQHGEVFDDGQPLQRYGTRRTWEKLLEANGLRVVRTFGYGSVAFPRTLQDWIWLIRRPLKLIRGALNFLVPLNLANHFVFLCEKKPKDGDKVFGG